VQQPEARDYCLATGEAYSVRQFAELAFGLVGLVADDFITVDPRYFRPAEVDYLLGDAEETRKVLDWHPRTDFAALVKEMVDHDLELAAQERTLIDAGHQVSLKGVGNQ
jgi:GDPmannose 4,6-dehydratase